jgi:hypothetical protein
VAVTKRHKTILAAIGVGVVVGLIVGGVGAYLNLSAGIRGGITGALTVVALQYLFRQLRKGQESEVRDKS